MCAQDEHDHQELAPSPGRSVTPARVALIAVWAAAVVATTLYISTLVGSGPADPGTEHFRTAAATAVIVGVIVTCWYSNRRRAERLEAKRADPDFEKGFESGDLNGFMRAVERMRPWLPADVFIRIRNGHDHHVS